MAAPWVAWCLTVIGWVVSPIISHLLNKLFSYLGFDVSRELEDLEFITVPGLKLALRDATEKRMTQKMKNEDPTELENRLKSALYDAEDILDLVDYHRVEKEAIGDISIWQHLRDAVDACIARCNESWFGRSVKVSREKLQHFAQILNRKFKDLQAKLQRHAQSQNLKDLLAKLQQSLKQLTQQGPAADSQTPADPDAPSTSSTVESVGDIEQGSAVQPPTPDASSYSLVEMIRCNWSSHLDITCCYRSIISWTTILVSAVAKMIITCYQLILILISALSGFYSLLYEGRNWSYKVIGIQKDGSAIKCLVPVTERIRVRKQIKRIQGVLTDPKKSDLLSKKKKKSDLLNQNTSSSTGKGTDKEGSSSSSKQKEIDNMYRSIEQKVFGRDKDREDISRMLRKGPYPVIVMHGITGSGKSTLAQYVCNYEKDKGHFNSIMFINVHKTFSVSDTFCDMLEQINQTRPSSDKDLKTLKEELTEKLNEKCFLLVLDDLWPISGKDPQGPQILQERAILLDVFHAGRSGSRILVTSETKDAASGLGAQEQILIPDLQEKEFLNLFMHHALQGAIDEDERFEKIGEIIAKKLHRSPIAAVAVGRRLQAEKSISFWETTAKLDLFKENMDALWWSYQQLCADTRRCFQYCSTFPKGYGLYRDELVRSWVAHGFVNTTSNATEELEDVGLRCLQELVKFSFLQVVDDDMAKFTIHDLLHKLAEMVAGSDFFRIDDSMGLPTKDISPGVRHLFIGSKNGAQGLQTVDKKLDLGNLHTLIIREPYSYSYTKKRWHELGKIFERLFMRLKKLRVLIIELGSNPEELSLLALASVDEMKHLRYFSVDFPDDAYIENLILPSTFSKLYQMQTIFFCPYLSVSCPDGMANLIRLRHIRGWFDLPNAGRMTSLQTMDRFGVKKKQGYELKQLKHLNKLRGGLEIGGLENVGSKEEALEADLASKKQVTNLLLFFDEVGTKNPDIEAEVLEGLCPPKDLQALTIQGYRGSRYPSWMLSGHQHRDAPKHLRQLVLQNCSCPLASFPEDSELFMNLRELRIAFCKWDRLPENMECLMSLQSLEICGDGLNEMMLLPALPRSLHKIGIFGCNLVLENMEHLVSLESLNIFYCTKMEDLPKLPESLQKIMISVCDVLSRTCQEEGHVNWQKIQHIPCKEII